METKICFKCGQEKPLSEFYRHSQMADGHLNKCKECTKRDEHERYIRNVESPEYVDKERARGRDKYRRLYAGRVEKNHSHLENSTTRRNLKTRGIIIEGRDELHHWNYNKRLSVFVLSPREHKKAHASLTFDAETGCFKCGENLLDTAEKHRKFLEQTLGRNDITFIDL